MRMITTREGTSGADSSNAPKRLALPGRPPVVLRASGPTEARSATRGRRDPTTSGIRAHPHSRRQAGAARRRSGSGAPLDRCHTRGNWLMASSAWHGVGWRVVGFVPMDRGRARRRWRRSKVEPFPHSRAIGRSRICNSRKSPNAAWVPRGSLRESEEMVVVEVGSTALSREGTHCRTGG